MPPPTAAKAAICISKSLTASLASSFSARPLAILSSRTSSVLAPISSRPTPALLSATPKANSTLYPSVRQFATSLAKMSTMPATSGHSEACCNIPPVISKGYEAKGQYEDIGGKKTYVTGPDDAKKAILVATDIFGYFPQTLQGADILATSDDHQKYKVFAPDFFNGGAAPIEWYPPNTPEKQQSLGAWFGQNPPAGAAANIPDYVRAVQAKFPDLKDWGIIGYCWGGKVVSLVTSSDSNPFKAGAECHPAMVDPKDAENVKVPLIVLASKDEPADAVKQFEETLKVPKHVEVFSDQIHGWMAARSDLEDNRVKEEYARGYKAVLTFFQKHL